MAHVFVCDVQAVLYPLDTVRTRLAVSAKGTYRGILDTLRRIRAEEGALALYRGIAPNMIGILPYAGVDIAMFEMIKEELLDRCGMIRAPSKPPRSLEARN